MNWKKFEALSLLIRLGLIAILVSNLSFFFWSNRSFYLSKYDIPKVENLFFNSQFAPKVEDRRFWIDDYDLFAYLGYRNIKGEDPSRFNFETPPLGKYFFGLSILVFANPNVIQIFFSTALIFALFFLSKELLKNTNWALIPPLILSFDLLFKQQSRFSLLDLPQTLFIILSFVVFLKAVKNGNRFLYLILGIFLGAILTIKFLTTGLLLILTFAIYLFLKNKTQLRLLLLSFLVAGIFYLLVYLVFFINHPNLVNFLTLHIKMLRLYRSHVPQYPKGEIFRALFTGWWRVWFGDSPFIRADTYSFLWTLGGIALLFSTVFFFLKKIFSPFLPLLWIWVYLFFTSLHIIFPRFVFPVLPFLYLILVLNIKEGVNFAQNYLKKKNK